MARSVRKFKETVDLRSLPLQRLKSHRYFPVAAIAALVLVAACIHVWQRVVVISLVKEISVLQKENRRLVDDAHKVRSEIASLSRPTRIERYAIDSLGLQRVAADQIITLIPGSDAREAGDELAAMISSIGRITDYLPVMTEAQAKEQELRPINLEYEEADEVGP